MQRLEVSGAVRHIYASLGFKRLILSFHLRLGLPSGHFPSGFPTKCRVVYENKVDKWCTLMA